MIKAISLWQPWATLVACGAKRYETRAWATSYRGILVIHAAKRSDDLAYWYGQPEFNAALRHEAGILDWRDLPLGAALAVVLLVGCHRADAIRHRLSTRERAFGDYSDGRWAWELSGPVRFVKPIPVRGKQGLFDIDLPRSVMEMLA